jgi:hypothetical protein
MQSLRVDGRFAKKIPQSQGKYFDLRETLEV